MQICDIIQSNNYWKIPIIWVEWVLMEVTTVSYFLVTIWGWNVGYGKSAYIYSMNDKGTSPTAGLHLLSRYYNTRQSHCTGINTMQIAHILQTTSQYQNRHQPYCISSFTINIAGPNSEKQVWMKTQAGRYHYYNGTIGTSSTPRQETTNMKTAFLDQKDSNLTE